MDKIYQNGDILVFKAGGHWLSQCIALLTHSDVSHAAMIYQDNTLVEMELPGVQTTIMEAEPGDTAYLLRLQPHMDPQPLIDAAAVYLEAKTRYDLPALVILAGMLIYRDIRPTPKFSAIADLILKTAAKLLDEVIQKVILDKPDKAMVCSQLVYQIYADCDKPYHIKIDHGILGAAEKDDIRLIDMIHSHSIRDYSELSENQALTEPITDEYAKELANRLCEVIKKQETEEVSAPTFTDINTLATSSKIFIEKLEKFLEKIQANIPMDSLFVMPCDLAYHSKNLTKIAELNIIKHNTY